MRLRAKLQLKVGTAGLLIGLVVSTFISAGYLRAGASSNEEKSKASESSPALSAHPSAASSAKQEALGKFQNTPQDPGLISGMKQLTFQGPRSGEGYFSRVGRHLIFQSERQSGNPF